MAWKRPSDRIGDLIRQGAELVLSIPSEWVDELDEATMSAGPTRTVADDPVLAAAARRTNRSNLKHWALANVRDPGVPVSANLGPEPLGIARDLVRRGLDDGSLDAYRIGQNVAWRRWMQIAFDLTSDPDELRELLDISSQSITSFIDATIAGISAQMQLERDELTRGTHAERREVVALILEGAPITRQRAQEKLGYNLDQAHTAAVVWSDAAVSDLSSLESAVDALAPEPSTRSLAVVASAATRWVWVPGSIDRDSARLRAVLDQHPEVRVALGTTASGVDGFRRSHLDAVTTQRMLARLNSTRQLASFEDVQLVSLIIHDPELAERFIKNTLGHFETASPELRNTVLCYVNEQCNAARAATRLYTHRNTLLRRLARADELLPQSLERNSVHVAAALEVLHWRGDR
jgi:DNA-binding PucR family transcriptional regulator